MLPWTLETELLVALDILFGNYLRIGFLSPELGDL